MLGNIRKLKTHLNKKNGRNGKILCFTKRGFKLKLAFRLIDFYLNSLFGNIYMYIKYINDSFRNAKLILCLNIYGFYFYILGITKIKLPCYFNMAIRFRKIHGAGIQLKDCNEGDLVSNLSFYNSYYGQIGRSAGAYVQIMKTTFLDFFAVLKLKTGKKFIINNNNNCMLGVVSNSFMYNLITGKAGFNFNYGRKMKVRGVAMNPIDHPNGGRTPGGKVYRSYSFKIARSRKNTSSSFSRVKNFSKNKNYI